MLVIGVCIESLIPMPLPTRRKAGTGVSSTTCDCSPGLYEAGPIAELFCCESASMVEEDPLAPLGIRLCARGVLKVPELVRGGW